MNASITGVTVEYDKLLEYTDFRLEYLSTTDGKTYEEFVNDSIKQRFAEFSGKNAGICYMSESYDQIKSEDVSKSLARFIRTIKSTHHSIADHCNVTVVFEGVPKFFAMIMNSFQVYATSEKSARYTVMENMSKMESDLYNKWRSKLQPIIEKDMKVSYGKIDENHARKLAQENARYFISIFSPCTTFSYTASIRQWNYIYRWFKDFLDVPFSDKPAMCHFTLKVSAMLTDFTNWFEKSIIYNDIFIDPKGRKVDFINQLYSGVNDKQVKTQTIGDVYSVTYSVSFTALAQLQRHRTIKYMINDFNPMIANKFFVPDFIKYNRELVDEWLDDMSLVRNLYPQGLKVEVAEMGTIDNFLLKCDERLCGRAQYETMKNCVSVLERLYCDRENMSEYYVKRLTNWFDERVCVKSKCQLRDTGCSDGGCMHGPTHATNRSF